MSFSQSLCFGENTLQELEKAVKVSTPNRSTGVINSDSDIIEESPTNHSSVLSYRERKQFNKSKTFHKKRKVKSRSSGQLSSAPSNTNSSVCSNGSLSQFMRSEYDFGDEISKILPGSSSKTNNTNKNICDSTTSDEKAADNLQKTENGHCYESEMFSQWIVPTVPELPPKPTTETKANDKQSTWGEDSYMFNDIDLDFGNEIQVNNELLQIDEEIGLGLDNVTFSQNFFSGAENIENINGEEVINVDKSDFIDKDIDSDNDLFTEEMKAECLELSMSRNTQMNSTVDDEEVEERTDNVNENNSNGISNGLDENLQSHSIKKLNSIDSWGLPLSIVREYHRKNIYEMFDWQRECLSNRKVLFDNANLVYCAPTSAGKTLVSEILMIKNVLEKEKKCLVILPFVSVVMEKMKYLQELLTSSGIVVEGYFGGYSPRSFDTVDVAVCTIEKANVIVNKLLEQKKIDSIGCIVMDEVHLISDHTRGYVLELLLAKILYVDQKIQCNIQVIAMSATLPNLTLLTDWLRAEFYHTDYRPVVLTEMIKINGQIFNNKMELLRTISDEECKNFPKDIDNIGQLCVETIVEGGSVIVFCPSKEWCERLSNVLSAFIFHIRKSETDMGIKLRDQIKCAMIEDTKNQLRNCPTGLDTMLDRTLSNGCSFHHAGLTTDERDIVESSFKSGSIRIIVSTSTLSSGVNLPARRVIIRSPMALGKMMDALTYKQMIGRAGRTGRDTVGESILICDSTNKNTGTTLIAATLKPLTSCLSVRNFAHLKRAILEINACGMATTKADLEAFCQCTLYASEQHYKCEILERDLIRTGTSTQDEGRIITDPIGISMSHLLRKEFIQLQRNDSTNETNFIATRLGRACLASSLPPDDALDLRKELQKSRESFVVETELHAIYLVTPYSICNSVRNMDWTYYLDIWEKLPPPMRRVGELVGVREGFLVRAVRGMNLDSAGLNIHTRFWTALAFEELVSEKNVNDVARKFRFPRGQLQSLQQNAAAFAAMVTLFCEALNWTMLAKIIAGFQERLFFGVHHDLVDLMKIPDLNSRRARVLYDRGICTLSDLANSDLFTMEKILNDSICFDTKQRDGESKWESEQRNKLRYLSITGKPGITVREAAKELIESARQCLELEMGVENIVWSNKSQTSQSQSRQKKVASTGITLRIQTDSADRDRIRPQQPSNRKRKLDDAESDSSECLVGSQRSGKKFRSSPFDTDSESDFDSDSEVLTNELACVRMNSAGSNLIENDQNELIEKLMGHRVFNEINKINVFQHVEFFKVFESIVKNSPVISVSVGVNQLLRRAPVIGLSSLVKQQHGDDGDIDSYNCTFDDDRFIAGISLCICDTEVYYLNLQNETSDDATITFDMKVKFLVELFHINKITFVMYDAKEQLKVLLKCFPQLRTFRVQLRDPLVANWLLQPDVYGNLLTMVRQYAPGCAGIGDISGINSNRRSIGLNGKSTVSPMMRSTVESFAAFHIMNSQMEHLTRTNPEMMTAFTDIEMPIQRVLLTMELVGFPVDERKISDISLELTSTLRSLENSMFQIHGRCFNVKSKSDKARVLGLKAINGRISTSKQVLEKLNHPIARLLLQHKTVHATLTGIIQPFIRQIVSNRIYPRSSCFSSTGRVHLSEPSLQNVTNDFEVSADTGPKTISCRRVFAPCSGTDLISADFCQLELRILTHFCNDPKLTEVMRSNSDVFKMIAAKWNCIDEDQVTDKQRNDSKQICYGIIYGMGVRALAEKMDCEEVEAQEQQEAFLKCYSGIRIFTEKIIARARECKFIETISGRRRYLPDITSNNSSKRAKAERQAVNSTIQGSAADIAKIAMLAMDKCVRQKAWKNVNLVLHVHDELVYEAPKGFVNDVVKKLKTSMERSYSLNVPLQVKVKVGHDWGTMQVVEC
ncbi:DNA polymerase theta isoform X2 [Bradysia coprophila]|uniref:DNA polymerase theta isoform X2 n=1 Tax=Bradysia coprophila TaxID=38358 RepID=UPI00187D8066|nr:DNA polymerase theta isoform X2 [Bradysia coprophila]